MTMVNRLKTFTAMLGAAALVTCAFVHGDSTPGKATLGGINPGGVKLSDDVSNRFARQSVILYETQAGETLFALQIKPVLKPAPARPRDLVLVVDTSASQAGKFLDASRRVVDQIIQESSPADRISLWVINTPKATRNLSSGLKETGNKENLISLAKALENEYASGAVDLKNGLEKVLDDFDGKISRQQAIVYIGDAESAFAQLMEKDRYVLANKIRDAKVQFFAIPAGTTINGLNMHALATGTGGSVVRFNTDLKDPKKSVNEVVGKLREAMLVPVLNPTKFDLGPSVAEFYPSRLPPLRADAPTLVVGKLVKGKIPAQLEGTIDGRIGTVETKVTISEAVPAAALDNFFLTTIVRQWSESPLKEMPAVLRSDRTLALAFEQGRLTRDEYLTQAQWALGANHFDTAKNLSNAAEKLDPNNAEVKALGKVIMKLEKGELTLEKLKAATGQRIGVEFEKREDGQIVQKRVNLEDIAQDIPVPKEAPIVPVGDPNALLRAEQAKKSILEQQVNLTVQETLARGRELLRSGDPKSAKDLILAQRDSIRINPDVSDALRTQLINRMELLLTDIGQRGENILRARAEESERIARARANLMAAETMEAREERIRERVHAFTNLMSQARHEDAYREALIMQQEHVNEARPVPIEAQAVYQMGQASMNLREMRELTRIREDRFLLTMMQVEKSHIPFPDEPPVHFPPSKVWRDLLELRKRYTSSDFEGDLPPRDRRRMEFLKSALDSPLNKKVDAFQDLPIDFVLKTVADYASAPGAADDPSKKVTILIDADAFTREEMMPFDAGKKLIKLPDLAGVSLATALRLICEQVNGTYWVRRDYIEIVPAGMAIREKVIRVFPVEDLIVGIPNAINTSALQQNLQVLGATFSLGGGPMGGPVVFNGNMGGGFQFGGNFNGGGNNQNGAVGGMNPAGGLFAGGGVAGFGGGIQGAVGSNLGGQFGFQGQDYGPILVQLIQEVVARGEWAVNNNAVIGGGGMMGVDPPVDPMQVLQGEQLNSLGYWPPSRALIVRGTSRIHRTNSSKLKLGAPMPAPVNFVPNAPQANAGGNKPPNVAVAKNDEAKRDAGIVELVQNDKNLDPEKIYQKVLDRGVTDPGEVIACIDFMVKCRQFKHAAELLKASLRTGVVAEPWAQEALAIALEGSQGSAEEIERARLSAIDLAPKSPHAYMKASKAMSDIGDPDRALMFCREAARLEPNMPDPYINALVYAGDKKATLNSDVSAWAAGNLLGHDWTSDTAEYHLRAREHLKEQSVKFAAQNKMEDVQKVQSVLDNEKRRDLVVQLMWSGGADLDLKVREAIGTTCSSLEKITSAGGVLRCDDFTQKDDNRSETYTSSEAFDGSYHVTVDKVWGRPLGNKATLKITRHQGAPNQSVEIVTLDLTKPAPHIISFEGGRRKTLASVPPLGVPMDSIRKPDREREVMAKLNAMTNGTSVGGGLSGGTGTATQATGYASRDDDSSLVEMSRQSSFAASAPGGFAMRQQTTLSKDGRSLQLKMAPVFQTAGNAQQAKLKLDFIPGSE